MAASISRYCLSLLLLTAIATSSETNGTSADELREPRVSGRIVKLYSGAKPEPFMCAGEGFQLDPNHCAAFYRCIKERSGKFTVFRYQCAPGTVYDPDLETCNHPHSTRRIECGGTLKTTSEPRHTTNINEIEGAQSELPRPISTKVPIYAEQTTFKTPSTVSWILSTERQNAPTKMPWESIHSSPNALSSSQTKSPTSTSNKQVFSTQEVPSASILPPRITQPSSPKSDEPCTSDGFVGDSENCRKFYRCVSNLRGGYAKFEFSCSESTVWDDEIQGCNHPWAVKRSKCGRSMFYDNKSASTVTGSSTTEATIKETTVYNGGFGYKSNKTIQQQLQISHGSDVTQTQVQISNSRDVIQNQTQINYGDKIQKGTYSKSKQNQTQISYGAAVSQSQSQIDYGNKGVQTQLQIDHSKDSSQSQVQESATQSTTSTTKNKNANDCSESSFMGDSNDCKKFYRCVDNGRGYTRYEYSCGEGTLWDPEIEACNHAWAVKNCGGKAPAQSTTQHTTSTEETSESSTQHTKTTTSSTSSQAPDIDDEDDVGYGNQNNEDTSLPLTSTSTTDKSTTITQVSTTSSSTTRRPNEATSECMSSGFMGDANDCRIFYRCVDNGNGGFTKYEFKCGDGTVWDPSIEACNHAWAVKKCGGMSGAHKEETTTKKDNTTPLDNVHTTVTLIQITTQATTLLEEYDTGYGSQNQEPHESSTTKTTTTSKPTNPHKDSAKGSDCKSSGFMGDEQDCKKFYRCVDNGNGGYIKYEFTCGQGTVWDPKIEACNHAWAVEKCGGSHDDGGHETTSQPSTAQSTTVTDSTSGHTTENVKETEKPTTTTSSTTSVSTTHSSSNGKCSSSGFMGDSNDCKKFYRCVDNGDGTYTRYEFTCGDGTVWDPKIEACNHAWAVEKCGGASQQTITHTPQQTTQVMQDEEQDSGYATPSHNTSESFQSTTWSGTSGSTSLAPAGGAGICKNNGFMGDQYNCKIFYRCVDNGKGGYDRYEFQCGEGTAWDQSIEACNHAYAVKNCGGSGGTSTTHSKDENTTPYIPSSSEQEDGQGSTEKTTTTSQAQQESGQPMDEECKREGFYGDKNDCKKFYRCVDNGKGGFTKYEFKCGDGTSWNPDIQNCDHISSGRLCGSGTSQHTTTQESTHLYDEMDGQPTTTTKSTTTTTTGKPSNDNSTQTTKKPQGTDGKCSSEGFYANPSDCSKFYRCVDNGNGGYTKYDFSCGDGTVWNQEIQACDHPSGDGSCSSSSSNHHTTSSPSELSTSSQSESTTSSYSTTKTADTTEKTKATATTGNQCTAEGFYAHPNDCKKFVRCVDNGNGGYTRYEFSCGDGTVWVQEIQACDHDNDAHSCNAQIGTTSIPSNTENQTSGTSHSDMTTSSTESMPPNKEDDEYSNEPSHDESDDCTSEGYFGNKQDCRKFYRCVDNGKGGYTKYDFVCGEGTAWDSELQTCNHINEVQSCSSSTTAVNGNHQTTTNKNEESENTSSTTKATTTSESSSSSSTSTSNNKDTCESEGYFGNSNDCKKFYRCVDNGKGGYTKYDFTCGDGTIWDQEITTCNHPQDVSNPSCGSNQGSEESSTSSASPTTSSTTSSASQTTSSATESSTSSQNTSDCSQESSKKPANDKITCDKAGYYAHPSDCKKFYRCVDWDDDGKRFSVFHFECGEGTIWDPALDTCNHEESVYPQRNCQTQSQNVGGETDGTTTTTTEGSSTLTTEGTTSMTTDEPTTQESTTSEQTTAQQTTSESTTTKQTTQQTTTSEKTTTQETTTSEQTTTQQSTTSEQTTTEQSTTSEQTTTQQSTTSEQTTTQKSTTSQQTTTEQSTQQSTTSQESTTSEQTTEQTTTGEQTTTQETTTSAENTNEGSNEPTTQQSTASTEQTTDGTTTTEQNTDGTTTTEQSSEGTTEQATDGTTVAQSTDGTTEQITDGTTEQSTDGTTEQTTDGTTEQSTDGTTEQTTDGTTEQSTDGTTEQTTDGTTVQTTDVTTEQTTDGTTEQSTDGTTEQTTDGTTEQSTDETTTAESTTELSTTSTESDDQSTTEASSSTDKKCPETDDDQYALVCPTSFRRHPKYCNMFYQCTEDEETYEAKMAMFKCPNNTIYDESQTQCVTEDKADKKCNGEMANKRRFKRLGSYYKDPIVADKEKKSCPTSGFFSFEKQSECAKGFLKCERSKTGELQGYVYQCPDGYIYWSISKRCEKVESVRDCKRSSNDWSGRWNIPTERHNIARS